MSNPDKAWSEALNLYHSYDSERFNLPVNSLWTSPSTGNYERYVGTQTGYETLLQEVGKIIKVGNKYYRVTSTAGSDYDFYSEAGSSNTGSFKERLVNIINNNLTVKNIFTLPEGGYYRTYAAIPFTVPSIYLELQEITLGIDTTYSFTYNSNVTRDAPYEIIAAPLYNVTLEYNNDTLQQIGSTALEWFIDLGQKHASGLVYDVQIVPYVNIDSNDLSNYEIIRATANGVDVAWAVKLTSASGSLFLRT